MDPAVESGLWKHEGREIYEFYDKVFNCRRHGWLNLQSCHINLPFADDREYAVLHAAVILLLPMLPALAAGSPFREGKKSHWLDERLKTYANNQNRFPLIAGRIVPEPVFTEADYRERIFEPLGRQVAPINKKGILQKEWLNSRGAIARFDRGAVEIRVLDVQECPRADMAIAHLVFATLRALVAKKGPTLIESATRPSTEKRRKQFLACARHGFSAQLSLSGLKEAFDLPRTPKTAHDFWKHIHRRFADENLSASHAEAIGFILKNGNLAQRMLRLREKFGPRKKDVYPRIIRELADCLNENRLLK
jgi:gamma-glutamyl:cysteine ligase YbdK (ATP-grasp superfamily)